MPAINAPLPASWPESSIPIVNDKGLPTPEYLRFLAELQAWAKAIDATVRAIP